MLAGKARAYPSEAAFRCSTLGQTPGLTHKHYTRLESLAKVADMFYSFYVKNHKIANSSTTTKAG
jgi:hypothetical protein